MEEKLICIATAKSRMEAEQMTAFLKENDIYATVQLGIPELYTGDSVSGEKIMVSSQDKEKAQRLLQSFTPVETRASDPRKQTTRIQKAVNWILLGIIAAILIFAVYEEQQVPSASLSLRIIPYRFSNPPALSAPSPERFFQ